MGNRFVRLLSVLSLVVELTTTSEIASNAKTSLPSIGLLSVAKSTTIERLPGEPLFFSGGVFVAATSGAFELWAIRGSDGLDVRQVVRQSGKITTVRRIPADDATSFDFGLGGFLHLSWTNESGAMVAEQDVGFCPSGFNQTRTNDSGPQIPTYPQQCGFGELTRAAVWGIDQGWATGALSSGFIEDPGLDDGTYSLRVTIADKYVRTFDIPSSQRSKTLSVTLTTFEDPGPCPADVPCPGPSSVARTASASSPTQTRAPSQ